jgi:predicted DNA-binding protein (UPF0251 family)/predicted Fe-Mo cluster-binding NifX family protein
MINIFDHDYNIAFMNICSNNTLFLNICQEQFNEYLLKFDMPREKNIRILNFKPTYRQFGPLDAAPNGRTALLHEEIEAIYLMDVLGLYQEEAAVKMGVSRPTFTRMIKSARTKVAQGLISGHRIDIADEKRDFVVAICADSEHYDNMSAKGANLYFYRVDGEQVSDLDKIANPVAEQQAKPSIVLPQVFLEEGVNIFICSQIGEGLKNTLVSKGIRVVLKESLKREDILSLG